jgi:mRNA-degrading endonuclease RelE of RelBE toxin-antitoxin system
MKNHLHLLVEVEKVPLSSIIKVEELLRRDQSFEKALERMEENVVKGRKGKYRVSVS